MFLSDEDIIINFKIKEREQFAFSHLITNYQEKVYRLIRQIVIDHEDANDITQDVFIKIWKNISKFNAESKLYTWIYRIAVNESITFLKKRKRNFFLSFNSFENQLMKKIDNSSVISGDEINIKLQKVLLSLPEKQRIVFNLRYFQELPYNEISEITNTSVGALKANYHHAVKKIEKYILEED